jgi:hypothetical protein
VRMELVSYEVKVKMEVWHSQPVEMVSRSDIIPTSGMHTIGTCANSIPAPSSVIKSQ